MHTYARIRIHTYIGDTVGGRLINVSLRAAGLRYKLGTGCGKCLFFLSISTEGAVYVDRFTLIP